MRIKFALYAFDSWRGRHSVEWEFSSGDVARSPIVVSATLKQSKWGLASTDLETLRFSTSSTGATLVSVNLFNVITLRAHPL